MDHKSSVFEPMWQQLVKWTSSWVVAVLLVGTATTGSRATGPGTLPLPAPGTYQLDKILRVPFSLVRVGNDWLPRLLSTYTTNKITLLTFFYSQCTDPQGCPLAWSAFQAVRDRVLDDPQLKGKVQLVFYSFDPVHDGPQILQFFADANKKGDSVVPWYFMTAWNDHFLETTLAKFGQDVGVESNNLGERQVVINHLLKVFLIDPDGWVREIYTSKFLIPDVIMGDIQTLWMEKARRDLAN